MFIAIILSPFFLKNAELSQYLENSQVEKWWWLLVLPILFQGMMIFLPSIVQRRWRGGWFLTVTALSALFLISIHSPVSKLLTPSRSAYPVSQAIRALLPPNHELYQFGTSLYGIDFYNQIRAPLVGSFGEMAFGCQQLPTDERSNYFLSPEEFYRRCKEKGDVYCVTRSKKRMMIPRNKISVIETLWDNGEFCLLRLRYDPGSRTGMRTEQSSVDLPLSCHLRKIGLVPNKRG
jgi:hypothetical protein